jgi:Mg2+ and Co2+ transporter CorA
VTAWIDHVDPSRAELEASLGVRVDPDVFEELVAPSGPREPRPVLEAHGSYVFGVLVPMLPAEESGEHAFQEICMVATHDRLVTVRKSSRDGAAYDLGPLQAAVDAGLPTGTLVHRLVDDVTDSYLDLLDRIYAQIDRLEDEIDDLPPAQVRSRISDLRHELLYRRRTVSATRAAVRRVLDGRVDIGEHELFPVEIERLFGDTYDTLVRITEELDVARDLIAGVREHLQGRIAENQNEVGKKLTVIASLVLVPSLIVGFYGQNFEGVFDRDYWTLAVSTGLILASTVVQLALFRWRRWI